jgi:transposase-like protein
MSQKSDMLSTHDPDAVEDVDHELEAESEVEGFGKSKVDCICPMCGRMHITKMRWIGRGVPRKFCQNCRDRETPLDGEE